ncbi:MAG TPA: MMPL family transporter [Solirubrobacteraceae bacterium]|jgi:RND superfamily putative drug exporter
MPLSTLTARAGRWSAQHRRKAILGWLAFVVLALAIGGTVGTQKLALHEKGFGESGRADRMLNDAGFADAARETILVRPAGGRTVADAGVQRAITDLAARLDRVALVSEVRAPKDAKPSALVAEDGSAALVQVQLRGEADEAGAHLKPVTDAVAAAARAHPEVKLSETGDGSLFAALDEAVKNDLKKAEMVSVPLTFAILFLAFGALVAAGIPVLLGMTAVAAALGLLALPSQVFAVEDSAASVILLIGLAVGVDYALFYLRREREERAAGRGADAALEAAAATSGRAVVISGLTVMGSVAGLFASGNKWHTSYAIGIMLVVGIAVVGSLTVLPAVLSALGDRVERGRIPGMRRREVRAGEAGRFWSWLLDRVLRRPVAAVLASSAVLLALAAPVAGLHLGDHGMGSLPQDMPAVKAFADVQAAFPGGSQPAVVALSGRDVTAPAVRDGIAALSARAAADPRLGAPLGVDVNPDHTAARVIVPVAGDGVEDRSLAAVEVLREDVVASTVGRVPGLRADVAGVSASSVDLKAITESRVPLVVALVLGLGFVVLLVTFRSVVIPFKAIVLNLLSVAAAHGVLVLVFQHGWGASLLGFEPTGRISSWLPVMLFVILFGLSMDYHVFVLTRIREAFDAGRRMDDAVSFGIRSTASVVTSAAAVMVAVFSIFATLGILEMKQLGVGLAVAILLDATIVRAVLLPTTMKLLGEWNWWLPRSLHWLPGVAPEPSVEGARA